MRKFTIEHTVYKFDELSEEARASALDNLRDINVDFEWWDGVYMDASEIGLKLEYFDLDRNLHATGALTDGMEYTIEQIKENHGESTKTYKLACEYDLKRALLVTKYADESDPYKVAEGNEDIFDDELDDLEAEFLKELLAEYANILQEECDYLTSDEAVIQAIEGNNYEFYKDGKLA